MVKRSNIDNFLKQNQFSLNLLLESACTILLAFAAFGFISPFPKCDPNSILIFIQGKTLLNSYYNRLSTAIYYRDIQTRFLSIIFPYMDKITANTQYRWKSGNFQPTLQPLDVFHTTVKRLKVYVASLYKNACPIQSNGYKAHDVYLSRSSCKIYLLHPSYMFWNAFLKELKPANCFNIINQFIPIYIQWYYMDASGWVRLVENMCARYRLKWRFEWFSSARLWVLTLCAGFYQWIQATDTCFNYSKHSNRKCCKHMFTIAAMSEIFRIECVACERNSLMRTATFIAKQTIRTQ